METLEDCRVSPPPGTVAATNLPLTFLDVFWFSAPQVQRLFFYSLPYPSPYLRRTIVADLKNSLAIALQYFFPYAGNIVFPLPPEKPYISYKDGDSMQLIVVESKSDFMYLSGDHPRKVAEIQALIRRLPPPVSDRETGVRKQALMEIQFTLFPHFGITIAVTYLHAVADGRSFSKFMKTWATVHRSGGNISSIQDNLPCHDRHLIEDEKDISSVFIKDMFCYEGLAQAPSENMRVTFLMSNAKIATLKDWVKMRWALSENDDNDDKGESESLHVSTFVVCVAYMWVCLTKLEDKRTQSEQDTEELCHLIFLADCRERLEFHVPPTYFGNCISPRFLAAKKSELVGENGLLVAAKAIADEVLRAREEPFVQVEIWLSKVSEIAKAGRYFLTIAGSPKFRVYDTDFGWGKPKKTDCAHIVTYGSVSLEDGGRDEGGGVELGLVVDQQEMGTLTALFEQGLKLF